MLNFEAISPLKNVLPPDVELNHFSFQLDIFVSEQEKLAMSVFDPNLHLVQNMMKHRNFRHL